MATVVFLLLVAAAVLNRTWLLAVLQSSALVPRPLGADVHIVQPNESIGEAIARAAPGTEVVVEPGEYREQLTLKDGVRVVSRVPRAARLRLPAAAPDGPAVIANGVVDAAIAGFTIVGDAATPLGVGIHANDSTLSIVDVAISGASRAGLEFSGGRTATLLASEIHDNPGAALIVRSGASPRIAHNAFARNGRSEPSAGAFLIEAGAAPAFRGNVFVGVDADALAGGVTATAAGENWFVPIPPPAPSGAPAVPRKPR